MTNGLRIDLHVHSIHSPDGRSSVDDLVAALLRAGLDGLALTDHNSVAGHRRLAELAIERPTLRLIPGVEVSTREGHLLGYGVDAVPPSRRSVEETVRWIVEHGGVPVPAHPFRWSHGVGGEVVRALRVPALETVNGHNGRSANARAAAVAQGLSLGSTGGSDAHAARELGRGFTRFPQGADAVGELLTALRGGGTVGEGTPLGAWERARIALRTASLRLARGLRPI